MVIKRGSAFAIIAAIILVFILQAAIAHIEEEQLLIGSDTESVHLEGYDIDFIRPEKSLYVGKEIEFSSRIIDPSGKAVSDIDVQGQILDSETGDEIFYSAASMKEDGLYLFKWKPSFAGKYFAQFVFRAEDEKIMQPSFPIRVDDLRGRYALTGTIIVGIIFFAIGIYSSLPKKNRQFMIKPLLVWVGLGIIIAAIGYSVNIYYQSGGEKGFVICDEKGCDLALHWHTELDIDICGEKFNLPLESGLLDKQHTHKERNKLHYHALIKTDTTGAEILEPEKLRLGELFDYLKIRFNGSCFGDYCNMDKCKDGKEGRLSMTVNNAANDKHVDYVWKDGDGISIKFE